MSWLRTARGTTLLYSVRASRVKAVSYHTHTPVSRYQVVRPVQAADPHLSGVEGPPVVVVLGQPAQHRVGVADLPLKHHQRRVVKDTGQDVTSQDRTGHHLEEEAQQDVGGGLHRYTTALVWFQPLAPPPVLPVPDHRWVTCNHGNAHLP